MWFSVLFVVVFDVQSALVSGCVSGICAKGMKRVHDDSVQRFYEELTKNMRGTQIYFLNSLFKKQLPTVNIS